jgi:calcineurin-like phosphoesterase family protein
MKISNDRNVWITSDWHFNHTNITGPKISRWSDGFRNFDSIEEMNTRIIDNCNAVIGENDVIINLGDVIFGHNPEINLAGLLQRIKCKEIHLVYGNHDKRIKSDPALQKLFASVQSDLFLNYRNKYFHCYHYPVGSWDSIGRGAIQLHGHCHATYTRTFGKQKDVGVDTNDMKPYNLQSIIDEMNNIGMESPDHHSEKTSYH